MPALLRSPVQRSLAAAVLLGSLYAAAASAQTTINFGTLPMESVNGVTADGVTFGYTEQGFASPEAFFDYPTTNFSGGAQTQLVGPYALVGLADGELTLDFATAVSEINFAVALTTDVSLTPGFSVSVFNAAGDLLDSSSIDTTPLVLFSEGEFSYNGGAASSVQISFDPGNGVYNGDADEFALGSVIVPEPDSIALFAVGLFGLGAVTMRRRWL